MEKVIALCGAGGKTTMIWKLAKEYQSLGKKVFVTTTTKMFRESFTVTDSEKKMEQVLTETGFVMAGSSVANTDGPGKITSLPDEIYERLCAKADIVLVEADGSRHHSVKVPNATDIVLPANVTDIFIIMGTWDIGRPVSEAVHRYNLLSDPGITENNLVSRELIDAIIDRKYLPYCHTNAPAAACRVFYSQTENETLQFTERI